MERQKVWIVKAFSPGYTAEEVELYLFHKLEDAEQMVERDIQNIKKSVEFKSYNQERQENKYNIQYILEGKTDDGYIKCWEWHISEWEIN
ncbi:MAG: hypothetical protein J6N78_01965 [Clostridia bacterium]|nr:hypothetical protein [Clostridia bacterium]